LPLFILFRYKWESLVFRFFYEYEKEKFEIKTASENLKGFPKKIGEIYN